MKNDSYINNSTVIAIVSGKGGSGKTMLAAMLAKLFDSPKRRTLLVDADFGTGGLTYYMGLNEVSNISVGLTSLMTNDNFFDDENSCVMLQQRIKSFKNTWFVGIGDHRRYLKSKHIRDESHFFPLKKFLTVVKSSFDVIIIDCRGGIDEESLAVCSAADHILIVAETDTTSFQSTQHLVDVLYDNDLSQKLTGFFINKVFDDPSTIARSGTSSFRTQYLSAIPFDLDATRSFLVGDIPSTQSYFGRQLWHGAYKCFPLLIEHPAGSRLRFTDFNGLAIRDKDSLIGGMLMSFLGVGLGMLLIEKLLRFCGDSNVIQMSFMLIIVSAMAGIEPARRIVGRALSIYFRFISRSLFGLK